MGTPTREGWGVVECGWEQCCAVATAIHRKPACRHSKGCARGGRPEDPSMADRKELRL